MMQRIQQIGASLDIKIHENVNDINYFTTQGLCGLQFGAYVARLTPYNHSECYCKGAVTYIAPGTRPECPQCLCAISNKAWQLSKSIRV